jgi:hypothetical protein
MLAPTVCHIPWKTAVLPVKWMPERSGDASSCRVMAAGSPGRKVSTPGGRPASVSTSMM